MKSAQLNDITTKRVKWRRETVILISRKQSFVEFNFRSNKDKPKEFLPEHCHTQQREKTTSDDGDDAKTNTKIYKKRQTEERR